MNALVYRFSSFSHRTIKQWSQGDGRPELARFLELCYLAELPVSDILIGKINIRNHLQQDIPIRIISPRLVSVAELSKMEIAIRGMLEEYPPPSIHETSIRLGCHRLTFKNRLPTQYQQIKERHSAYEAERYDREKISNTLLSARDELPPPSLTSIAKRLGCSPGFLRFLSGDDCRIISARYNEFRKAFADHAATLSKLHVFQAEFPPKSIGECAKELGCCRATLTKYFPDETRTIRTKYSDYFQKEAKQRKSSRRNIILAAANAVIAEQMPLTPYRIKARLPHIKCLINREIDEVLKEMRSELYIALPE